ncbi:unnamed protein product [Rotaria sp. Silwood2]|nr:unnamed protein product [Rotaria sp. Silwood2]CAF2492355.1 unnamed protein product [Rotaria sp. Silwood2]CAF2722436.1 unnamed protein product [Rotaria sp. Silwood2]CAF2875040.1 unnamed protein product [Rotaria sp. Silwood2]CAF3884369.1 unnamed protein product [Rotaria sp. Silwood2]
MTYRTKRSFTISNDEIGLQMQHRLLRLFQRHQNHRSLYSPPKPSPLYLACQSNDLAHVESCLKKMKRKEIDFQYSPNNETVLHVATRSQHKEIIKILLLHGAQRSLRNADGRQAYQLAETKEIKDLFKRPKSSRFVFLNSGFAMTTLFQNKIKCESCSLVNDNTLYEWELIDRNAAQKAVRFRREFEKSTLMNKKVLKQKLYSTKKGYLNARLQDISEADGARINDYFKRALRQNEPYYIVTAYTICQNFSHLLNTDMARNVIHDLKNGCSKFCCDCLYSTEDGTKAITSILLHHPNFQKLNFKGRVYRGIVASKSALCHYKVGSCIITTTFLSTSKDPEVAQIFCDKAVRNPTTDSLFCTYEIVNEDRTALDISTISEFEDEDEVLILPYSAFLITKIEQGQETRNIYLKELCLTHMFDSNGSKEWSINSTTCLLELAGSSLLHNTSEILLQESASMRSRSNTMPVLTTRF